jgi:hypothetical protein
LQLRGGVFSQWAFDPDCGLGICNAAKQDKYMKKLNCRRGHLAVVVCAYNLENIGTIL